MLSSRQNKRVHTREWLELHSSRFTSLSAFTREVLALLQESDYGLELVIRSEERDRLDSELEGLRSVGRLSVTIL